MYRHTLEELEGRFTRYGAIAFATAAIEHAMSTARACPDDVQALLAELVDRLWRWQSEEKVQGRANMSRKEARSLPSVQLYEAYDAKLIELQGKYAEQEKVRALLYAAQANLAFIVWQIDAFEALLNPGKPFVATCDITEVGWDTFARGLNFAIEASEHPHETFGWQRKTITRLADDHPAPSEPDQDGVPVGRDYFFGESNPGGLERTASSAPAERTQLAEAQVASSEMDEFPEPDELESALTDYAAVAFATAAVEHVMGAAERVPEVYSELSSIVADLWKWQFEEKAHGKEQMPAEEANALPSSAFYLRMRRMRDLASRYQAQPELHAILAAVIDALDFIVWIMDGVERRMNPGKPFVVGEEVGDREWEALTDALEWAAQASSDPDQTRQWQVQTLSRLSEDHPGDPDNEVLGQPVARDYFF
jgi:hypothetical protein